MRLLSSMYEAGTPKPDLECFNEAGCCISCDEPKNPKIFSNLILFKDDTFYFFMRFGGFLSTFFKHLSPSSRDSIARPCLRACRVKDREGTP